MKLNTRIKELRVANGMTLKDVAAETALSVSYLSDIERGRTVPALLTLAKIANVLKINVAELLTDIDLIEPEGGE